MTIVESPTLVSIWPEDLQEPTECFRIKDVDSGNHVLVGYTGIELALTNQQLLLVRSPIAIETSPNVRFILYGLIDSTVLGLPTFPGLLLDIKDGKMKISFDGVVWKNISFA